MIGIGHNSDLGDAVDRGLLLRTGVVDAVNGFAGPVGDKENGDTCGVRGPRQIP